MYYMCSKGLTIKSAYYTVWFDIWLNISAQLTPTFWLGGVRSHIFIFYILCFHIKDTAYFSPQYIKEDVVAKILFCVFLRVWSGSFFFLFHLFFFFFFDSEGGLPLLTWNLQYCTMILKRIRMTVKHAGFEWCLNSMVRYTNEPLSHHIFTNEPSHLLLSHYMFTTEPPLLHH